MVSSRAERATKTSASRRSPASRTTPPLPILSRPTSNCGLIMANASNPSEAAQASTAGSTLDKEMNDTSATTRSGR